MQKSTGGVALRLGEAQLTDENIWTGRPKFDLTLTVTEQEDGLVCSVEYSKELFDQGTIERMLSHFSELTSSVLSGPDQRIGDLSLLTASERSELLEVFNATACEYPSAQTVVDLFSAQVGRTPDHTAVVYGERTLSYAELDWQSSRLAHYLLDAGVGNQELVGICMERSIEMIVGILGILKAGGCYVPIDPEYPSERIGYMLSDTGARYVLVNGTAGERLPDGHGCRVIDVDGLGEELLGYPAMRPDVVIRPDQLAYIIYTSGSTGNPKGVMIEHRNIVALLFGFEQVSPQQSAGHGLSLCPYVFDVSVWEFFINLCFGNALHILPSIDGLDAARIVGYMASHKIATAYLPPTVLSEVVSAIRQLPQGLELERLLVGVMSIQQQVLQDFIDLQPGLSIINGYGPAETTVCASFFSFRQAIDVQENTPIGRPVANYQLYVLDKYGKPLPAGVPGQIWIGGAGVGRGYLNDPLLTAQKFVEHPFLPGQLIYQSGDMGKWLADGDLEYLGRADEQVKVRGYRIEPGEVETVMLKSGLVDQAVLLAPADQKGNRTLVAFLDKNESLYPGRAHAIDAPWKNRQTASACGLQGAPNRSGLYRGVYAVRAGALHDLGAGTGIGACGCG
jgi:amino acid adenylation domain-containing protein